MGYLFSGSLLDNLPEKIDIRKRWDLYPPIKENKMLVFKNT